MTPYPTLINRVKLYMRGHLESFRDNLTNEINTTLLAEYACEEFNLYEGDDENDNIPEWLFDLALDVSEEE